MKQLNSHLSQLRDKITGFGKENLEEMLHVLADGITQTANGATVRIYLEDLTRGALSCAFATGADAAAIKEITFPIISDDLLVSSTFASQRTMEVRLDQRQLHQRDKEFGNRFGIAASTIFPIISLGRPLGIICCDREHSGEVFDGKTKAQLGQFLLDVADRLDQARKYHQQLLLARQVDVYKRREAAGFMVRSAVQLVDSVALAAILVPGRDGTMEVLASHANAPELSAQYDALGSIGLERGSSLISNYLDKQAVIIDDRLLRPIFIPDLSDFTHPVLKCDRGQDEA